MTLLEYKPPPLGPDHADGGRRQMARDPGGYDDPGRDHASSRAVGPHAVEAVAVGDEGPADRTAGAETAAARGGAVLAAVHQAVELEGLGQRDEGIARRGA